MAATEEAPMESWAHTNSDQDCGSQGISAHFAAYSHGFPLLCKTVYDGSYQTEQGRVIGLIVGFHIGVPAVYCCEVLGQVIGANAGKVHFFGSLVRQKGDRGGFQS